MLFSMLTAVTLFLLSSLIQGYVIPRQESAVRVCGVTITSERIIAAERNFAVGLVVGNQTVGTSNATINVYWHVVSEDSTLEGGNIPDSQIADSISVLNQGYGPSGLTFKLVNTTRTENADWFDNVAPNTTQQADMKNQLRQGGPADLNIYSSGFTSSPDGVLGYSTMPDEYSGNPKSDGVVILFSSVPGGTMPSFNLGHTLTHETGHWVGLYHTFQGGCSDPGDMVSDTPAEAIPAFGCPVGIDTCTGAGVDPIHNFMDYSTDACMDNFTPGQITRMRSQISVFRGIN